MVAAGPDRRGGALQRVREAAERRARSTRWWSRTSRITGKLKGTGLGQEGRRCQPGRSPTWPSACRIRRHFTQVHESTFLRDILSWVVPALVFFAVWYLLVRRMAGQQGGLGGGFMTIGKSRAKVYVENEDRRHLRRRRRRRRGQGRAAGGRRVPEGPEASTAGSARACRRACCWSARPAPARRCSRARSPARPACRSSPSPARSSSRCSSASARRGCATCSSRRGRRRRHHLHRRARRARPGARRRRPAAATTRRSRR